MKRQNKQCLEKKRKRHKANVAVCVLQKLAQDVRRLDVVRRGHVQRQNGAHTFVQNGVAGDGGAVRFGRHLRVNGAKRAHLVHYVDHLVGGLLVVGGQQREQLQHVNLHEGIGNALHEALGLAVAGDDRAQTLHEARHELSETGNIRWGEIERKEGELDAYPSQRVDSFEPETSTP